MSKPEEDENVIRIREAYRLMNEGRAILEDVFSGSMKPYSQSNMGSGPISIIRPSLESLERMAADYLFIKYGIV